MTSDRWATFDCYGTLVDWMGGIRSTFTHLWPDRDADLLLHRYLEIEPDLQAGRTIPYRDVLTQGLERVASHEGLALPATERDALARSLPDWPAFPEVPESLEELRERGWRLAILSNTDPDLLDASLELIEVPVDVRITELEAGSYKPAHGHWERFFELTGADRLRHMHVAASIFHDIAPCAALGLKAVWINRLEEVSDLPRTAELTSLQGLADSLDALVPG